MPMRFYLFSTLLSLYLTHSLSAQEAPHAPYYPRFYVGASVMVGNNEVTYPRIRSYDEGVGSVGLTGGYQFASRGAVQLSVVRSRDLLQIERHRPVGTSQTRESYYEADHRNIAVPLILRLSGTKRQSHRMQFDALAGFVMLHASYSRVYDEYDDQQNLTSHEVEAERTTNLAVSLGVGARYRFGRHLEAVGDANFNHTLSKAASSRFVGVYTVGLRYRFKYE